VTDCYAFPPVVRIGTPDPPTPSPQASVPHPPPFVSGGGGGVAHSFAGEWYRCNVHNKLNFFTIFIKNFPNPVPARLVFGILLPPWRRTAGSVVYLLIMVFSANRELTPSQTTISRQLPALQFSFSSLQHSTTLCQYRRPRFDPIPKLIRPPFFLSG
jgi:hypothetical protein